MSLQRPFRLPGDAVDVVLVRHGSAAEDGPVERIAGHGDQHLTQDGLTQAERIADRLSTAAPAGLFVSPLTRTAQTAAPLARRLGIEPVVIPELREVHLGDWEADHELARRIAGRDPLIRTLFEQQRWDVIPNAEAPTRFSARVTVGIERLVAVVGPGATAVVFTHAGVIAEVCRQATGSRPFAFLRSDNAALSRIVVSARGRWALQTFNDVSHLV